MSMNYASLFAVALGCSKQNKVTHIAYTAQLVIVNGLNEMRTHSIDIPYFRNFLCRQILSFWCFSIKLVGDVHITSISSELSWPDLQLCCWCCCSFNRYTLSPVKSSLMTKKTQPNNMNDRKLIYLKWNLTANSKELREIIVIIFDHNFEIV